MQIQYKLLVNFSCQIIGPDITSL
uniref:Uncharacterized protein n=1 Tax=Anguilla anguilla TaxID=7936 RepID=A0A0E9RI68_ANGAN